MDDKILLRAGKDKRSLWMPKGGKRIGAGRPAGSTDRKIRKINVQEIMDRVGTGPDKMPLPFLLAMIHAPPEEESGVKMSERIQCAIAAAQYCHPKLSSVEVKSDNVTTLSVESDLGKALRELAEIARLRDMGQDTLALQTIEGEVLEPATLPEPDIMSKDIMTAEHFDQAPEMVENGEN